MFIKYLFIVAILLFSWHQTLQPTRTMGTLIADCRVGDKK